MAATRSPQSYRRFLKIVEERPYSIPRDVGLSIRDLKSSARAELGIPDISPLPLAAEIGVTFKSICHWRWLRYGVPRFLNGRIP